MKRTAVAVLFSTVLLCRITQDLSAQSLVFVGNPGNSADTNAKGAVTQSYYIGKYETTISEYTTFLNYAAKTDAYGLWYGNVMDIQRSGAAGNYFYTSGANNNTPVTWVNWLDAARYVNWMHNGANSSSSTENGAYTLNGALSGVVQKNDDAKYWLPTYNEWYKAAFYDATKNSTGGYWSYATQTDAITSSIANFQASGPSVVGSYEYASSYGTYDQSGNVWEWLSPENSLDGEYIGGGWNSTASQLSSSANGNLNNGGYADGAIGFRIASPVPEPSALSLLAIGLGGLAMMRRRRS
jgi:formylglycine-generating enzyme required for sulfatase activity